MVELLLHIHRYKTNKEEYLYSIKKTATGEELKDEWYLKFDTSSVKYILVKNVDEMIHLFDAIVKTWMTNIYQISASCLKLKSFQPNKSLKIFNEIEHITKNF